ncbi:DUF6302 family protein [Streptomyces marianii]|uniref:Uncharacterized protein n=1 Tax=Streptomyces marianii TaxID=1817406 RepID=A0A5R9DTB2_9ACTN|nr:DUF6302 family protein [Streptomyces marianii]TLQ39365.1 hypothetical protein FEF34_38955 [Streptomyces marianii]
MSSVLVRLLPAARASDYQQFRSILDDPALADEGIAVQTWGSPLLLVPVGGQRRGGYYPAATWSTTLQIWLRIRRRQGFPRTRIRWSRDLEVCHNVIWGAEPPQEGDRARGRFYGYSETAINDFLSRFPQVQEMPDAPA